MKRLLIVLLLIPQLAFGFGGMMGGGVEASCAASYGSEKNTDTNAVMPVAGDSDATTGWTNSGCATFDSIDTAPYLGSYHLTLAADGNNDSAYRSLSGYSLTAGDLYKLLFYKRHIGSGGDWRVGVAISGTQFSIAEVLTSSNTEYSAYSLYFRYNALFQASVRAIEYSATNDGGVYIDNLSVLPATLCYGLELYTTANAAGTIEGNATTDFTGSNVDTIESTASGTPQNGTYHIHVDENSSPTSSAYITVDLGTLCSLQAGKKYLLDFYIKHCGTGGEWNVGTSSSTGGALTATYIYLLASTTTTYQHFSQSFVYASGTNRYLKFLEGSATNDGGFYIDALSVKEITGE